MAIKQSDRRKYNPDGKNEYTAPSEKPPRHDLRRKHKTNDDPLDKKDKSMDDKLSSSEEETMDIDSKVAKRLAKQRLKIAGRPAKDNYALVREGLDNYQLKDNGVRAVAKTYKHLADSFLCMTKAVNAFTSCKSSEVSPDGKLGGKGYIQTIKEIRSAMADSLNIMSELIDTFHDEVNSPYWKKTTVEDNPIVKEILEKADKAIDEAEDLDEEEQKEANKSLLNDTEKNKILNILKSKGHL
jgi:hypothetical protein